jgi:hypothetical protein
VRGGGEERGDEKGREGDEKQKTVFLSALDEWIADVGADEKCFKFDWCHELHV